MKWTIGKKLGAGFGLAVIALAILGVVSFRSMFELDAANNLESATGSVLIELKDIPLRLSEAEAGLNGYLLTSSDVFLADYKTASDAIPSEIGQLRKAMKEKEKFQGAADKENLQRLDDIDKRIKERLADFKNALKSHDKKDAAAAAQAVESETSRKNSTEIHQNIDAFISSESEELIKRVSDGDILAERTEEIIVGVSVAMLIVLVLFSIFLTRNITGNTNRLLVSVSKIADGNLKQEELPVVTTDEIGALTVAFNKMLASVKDMTGQTRSATQNITSATAEIVASTQQQAASTAEQAAAVQQTTATVEEINQSGNQVSERAKQVAASAEAASSTSNSGIQAVQSANRTMDAIREQAEAVAENIVTLSEKTQTVGEIVATVNDIAEQSNLLALNAAIEAAAAGEHGRRFSVVAAELKNLADQSKAATVQVRTILGDIQKGINTSVMLTEETVKRVELGKQQSDVAERTIRQMAESTVGSVQAFQQIVAATNQQQIGFEQVTQALKNIRVASQQTAAGTQQMEKAAANLNALGQQLNKSVERYEL